MQRAAGLARFAPRKRYRPVSLRRRVRRRVRENPHRPEEEPRARGTPGVQKDPRASTPRDIEACRSVCSCRKSAKPKASRARCFRLAPHPPRWSAPPREGETCCVTTPPSLGPGIRRHSCDGSTVRLPAVTAPGVRIGHARRGAAWTAGPRTASPMQGHVPATAPRPASGDADQTPLGNGAG